MLQIKTAADVCVAYDIQRHSAKAQWRSSFCEPSHKQIYLKLCSWLSKTISWEDFRRFSCSISKRSWCCLLQFSLSTSFFFFFRSHILGRWWREWGDYPSHTHVCAFEYNKTAKSVFVLSNWASSPCKLWLEVQKRVASHCKLQADAKCQNM